MRHAVLAIASLALAAPAFAQQNLEQPRTPHDGVGVDYTQPYVNDLLLRLQPFVDGNMVGTAPRLSCEKQRNALAEDPLDPALDQAYEMCMKQLELQRHEFFATPAPNPWKAEPYDPRAENPGAVRRLPPLSRHPNVQN